MIVLHYTGMTIRLRRFGVSPRAAAKFPPTTLCSRTAGSCKWSRKAGGRGMPERPRGPGRPTSTPARSGSKSPTRGTTTAIRIFPARQIAAVTALCRSILTRYTIPTDPGLGHSDIAPARKRDPGEKFPWRTLCEFGHRPLGQTHPAHRQWGAAGARLPGRRRFGTADRAGRIRLRRADQRLYDSVTLEAVSALQRHFRPQRIDGICDTSTRSTLRDLLAQRDRPRNLAGRAPQL